MKIPAFLLATLLLTSTVSAEDRIYLTDGSSIDCTVVEESLKIVTFRVDGKARTAASESILRIEYDKKPSLVDQADTAAAEGAVGDAITDLNLYVDGFLGGSKPRRGQEWAPAYAMGRVIELARSIGDSEGVIKGADRLIKHGTDARQLPMAYLSKAAAQRRQGKADSAKATLDEFLGVIDSQELSERWRLECRLGLIQSNAALKPSDRRTQLQKLAAEAGDDYPTVKNSARVSEGESYLAASTPDFDAARRIFQRVVDDPKADDQTLAGAYVGLGDCIFQEAAKLISQRQDASALLKEALLNYLRVVVVYADEVEYRPKALFYAGRCYDLMADADEVAKDRARSLFRRLMRDYPGSSWAGEAQKFA